MIHGLVHMHEDLPGHGLMETDHHDLARSQACLNLRIAFFEVHFQIHSCHNECRVRAGFLGKATGRRARLQS